MRLFATTIEPDTDDLPPLDDDERVVAARGAAHEAAVAYERAQAEHARLTAILRPPDVVATEPITRSERIDAQLKLAEVERDLLHAEQARTEADARYAAVRQAVREEYLPAMQTALRRVYQAFLAKLAPAEHAHADMVAEVRRWQARLGSDPAIPALGWRQFLADGDDPITNPDNAIAHRAAWFASQFPWLTE